MKLWLLQRKEVEYDEHAGFVIRAESENEAREIASMFHADCSDDGGASCVEISMGGAKGVILSDFCAG